MLTLTKFLNYTLSIELLSFFRKFSVLITLIILNSRRPTNPEQAVRLGKKALQDQPLMKLLWQKFKNQTKIALILEVNKSTVNRRFKEYDLVKFNR